MTAGLHLPTAVKRGLYTIHQAFAIKTIGKLSQGDARNLERSLLGWLHLPYKITEPRSLM
jgi:mRNA interferase MazF